MVISVSSNIRYNPNVIEANTILSRFVLEGIDKTLSLNIRNDPNVVEANTIPSRLVLEEIDRT